MGPYWAIRDHKGPEGTIQDHTRPYCTIQDHTGPFRIEARFGPMSPYVCLSVNFEFIELLTQLKTNLAKVVCIAQKQRDRPVSHFGFFS